MPRHQRAVGRHPTQGQRNTGVCGHRKFGGDAWNHLKGNASLVKNTALLPSPAEHKGVTTLQAHHHPAGPDMLHHKAVYLVLRNRMGGGALAHVDAFCLLRRVIQYGLVHESVVQNDVGPLETAETAEGDQPRIPRSSAYQVDTDPIQQIRRPVPNPSGDGAADLLNRVRVYLVGAGPGDPGLITLRGLRCLERADVVLYDRLVDQSILDHAPEQAERIYVGKRTASHTVPQDEINRLMVEHVRAGRVVVRLK